MSAQPSALSLRALLSADDTTGIRERMFRTMYAGERRTVLATGSSGDMPPQLSYYAAKIGVAMRSAR